MHSTVFNEIYPNKRKKEENPREGHQLTATESKPNREACNFLLTYMDANNTFKLYMNNQA